MLIQESAPPRNSSALSSEFEVNEDPVPAYWPMVPCERASAGGYHRRRADVGKGGLPWDPSTLWM